MPSSVSLECKKLCVRRCFYAVLYSVAAQFVLLTTFLLFVNFSALHPFDWLYATVAAILSWRTWLSLLPLLAAVVAHGILLGKAQLAERRFHPNRFATISRTAGPQASLFAMHMAIGLLTAWLYVRYLPAAYATPFGDCAEVGVGAHRYCLNDSYVLLLLAGCYTSMYYFVRERCRRPLVFVQFPLVQQARYLEMRTNVHAILVDSLRAAVLPTVAFAVAGYLLGDVFVSNVAHICGMGRNTDTMSLTQLLDPSLWLWMFVIAAQIISNMRLVDHLFGTFLTEHMQFPVERPPRSVHLADDSGYGHVVTLCDALAATATPLVQELAALDLATLCDQTAAAAQRRQQVFALSVPGGHPYTWSALAQQCLALIDGFRTELQTNVERALAADGCTRPGVAHLKGPAAFGLRNGGGARPPMAESSSLAADTASEMAAKLMTRQYNETYGIRPMQARSPAAAQQQQFGEKPADPCRKFNETVERVQLVWQQFKQAIMRLPGNPYHKRAPLKHT